MKGVIDYAHSDEDWLVPPLVLSFFLSFLFELLEGLVCVLP